MTGLRLRVGKVNLNNMSSIVRDIRRAAGPQLASFADRLGTNGKRLITAEAKANYNTSRPASRRRHPGSLRLGSGAMFDYTVTAYASGDAATHFAVKGGAAEQAKFGALNFGSGGHDINPVKGAGLAWPTEKGNSKTGTTFTGGRGRDPGVRHPGTTGTHFFEKGIAKARRTTR